MFNLEPLKLRLAKNFQWIIWRDGNMLNLDG
jgi:hypothetical protein